MSCSVNKLKIVALDCSTVGGSNNQHILARVSIVDFSGKTIFDTFVSPETGVRDYRFKTSGVKQENLIGAPSFSAVQRKVHDIISDRIVVGHNLHFNFLILGESSSIKFVRDIGINGFIVGTYGNNALNNVQEAVPLKKLSKLILQRDIQIGFNDSIENAKAVMDIYKYFQMEIDETHLKEERNPYPPQMDIFMEPESSNTTKNLLIAGGILAGVLAVSLSIFGHKSNNNK